MPASDVAAVVLNYRTPEKTLGCLASLVAEGVNFVILVENSEDGGHALEAMAAGLRELEARGIEIVVVDHGRNLGFAAGVNRGLEAVLLRGARPVLLMNSDARLVPGSLQALLRALPDAAAVSPFIEMDGWTTSPRIHYQTLFATLSRRRFPGTVPYIAAACLLLSRELVVPDLFDEDFFFYGEDVALGAKLQRLGKAAVVVSSATAAHEGSGSSRRGSLFYEYHINRGHWLLAKKLATGPMHYAASIMCRCAFLPARAIYRALRLRAWAPMRGFAQATVDALANRRPDDMSKPTG